MEKVKIRRRRYLIKTRFQLKYTGLILVFMFIVTWIVGYTIYHTGWFLMGEKLSNVYPQGRLVAIMRTINATLLLRLFLIAPIVILVAIILSHRVAGPIFRIERYLKSIASGDFSMRLTLRKNDELKDLAEAINDMTDDLKNRIHKIKGLVNMATLEVEKLNITLHDQKFPNIDTDIIKGQVEEVSKSIKDVEDHLSKYRLTTIED